MFAKTSALVRNLSVAAILLALLPSLAFAGKKKQAADAKPDESKKRIEVDTRKLVWPNPPAIARVRFLALFVGQEIDWNMFDKSKRKPKQKWMDRLAGAKPQGEQIDQDKIPYQLIRTYGVAADNKGNIYAADQGVGAIFIFNPETKQTTMIRNGKEAHFGLINGIAVDDNGRIFVTDDKFREVLVFNEKHEQETAFGADFFASPSGIAVDSENRLLYVADTQNDVIDVFDADSLKLLRKIGTPGKKHTLTDPGTFSLPTGVALDTDGNLYVSDTLNARIQIFDADGNFISQFGKRGDGPWQLERPKGIAIDGDGHIWVVDSAQDRIKVFNREGRLLIYIGTHGDYPGQFREAYGIAIDKLNRVITSEQYPGRVQLYRYITDAEAAQIKAEPGKAAAIMQDPAARDKKASEQAQASAPK
jgi:DNA-binding beta-propeller fold protein YncE